MEIKKPRGNVSKHCHLELYLSNGLSLGTLLCSFLESHEEINGYNEEENIKGLKSIKRKQCLGRNNIFALREEDGTLVEDRYRIIKRCEDNVNFHFRLVFLCFPIANQKIRKSCLQSPSFLVPRPRRLREAKRAMGTRIICPHTRC